jgi:cell wall-associated NlpC family hydrolase
MAKIKVNFPVLRAWAGLHGTLFGGPGIPVRDVRPFRGMLQFAFAVLLAANPLGGAGAQTLDRNLSLPPGFSASGGEISPAPTSTQPPGPALPNRAGHAEEVILRALSQLGVRYRYGGNDPETGFDCSGLVNYAFREALGKSLPRSAADIWRTTAATGEEVTRDALIPGDLVFFNTLRRPYSHVGIYLGEGRFVHAPSSGGVVRIESMEGRYWVGRYNGARRVL